MNLVVQVSESAIYAALSVWPELTARRVRPVLVGLFGDIFVETLGGEIMVARPLSLDCEVLCTSVDALKVLFQDADWEASFLHAPLAAEARLLGISRKPHQVYALLPHPLEQGAQQESQIKAMDLNIWHHTCNQLRGPVADPPGLGLKAR